jgi:hypothetical protein
MILHLREVLDGWDQFFLASQNSGDDSASYINTPLRDISILNRSSIGSFPMNDRIPITVNPQGSNQNI